MKRLKLMIPVFSLFAFCTLQAQVDDQMSNMNSGSDEIASETTEKTYKVIMNDKVVKNTVKINTTRSQKVMLAEKDQGMVNQERDIPKTQIVKTVMIDNDEDDAFDEQIVFRYEANAPSDFVLMSNDDEIVVALDEGENLKILESKSLMKDEIIFGKEAYVFTDNNGTEVEFFIDEYKSLEESPDK